MSRTPDSTIAPTAPVAVVTCGPSYEPIDRMRRITNASTGKLGILLANALNEHGWTVICLAGHGATHPEPLHASITRIPFTTNAHLLERLEAVPERDRVGVVFHAAALCDFRVKQAVAQDGTTVRSAKIPSRAGEIQLVLEPAPKVLPHLAGLFPAAKIVGWKYELEGSREEALSRAQAQLAEVRSAACVLNGAAYGPGFALLQPGTEPAHFAGYPALVEGLSRWAAAFKLEGRA